MAGDDEVGKIERIRGVPGTVVAVLVEALIQAVLEDKEERQVLWRKCGPC
ncbi:hypothetical protein [Saccharopolyspora hattusasensis]